MKNQRNIHRLLSALLTLAFLLSCCPALPLQANAADSGTSASTPSAASATASGTCGENLTWTLDEDGTLTISGTGPMTNYSYNSNAPWYSKRSSIKTVVIENGVTTIGNYAFSYCTSLTSVTIPNSVTAIGNSAFFGCTNLKEVHISDLENWCKISFGDYNSNPLYYAKKLYQNGVLVTDLVIPDSITTIGDYAFRGYTALTSVTIPNSVTSIGKDAFLSCVNLTSITIGNSVTAIGEQAFVSCGRLTCVTIPNSVSAIGEQAFYGCDDLTCVTIGNGVTSIGKSAFDYCTSLSKVIYCGTQEQWDAISVDNGNTPLTDAPLQLHNYVNGVCNFCQGAQIVASGTCGENLTWMLDDAGTLTIFGTGPMKNYTRTSSSSRAPWHRNRSSIKSVVIENDATSIGAYAFYECTGLTSITIPNSVISIGDYAFYWCDALTDVTIPASVTSIGVSPFFDCKSLTGIGVHESNPAYCSDEKGVLYNKDKTELIQAPGTITGAYLIPNSVNSIGDYAFYRCIGLTSITIPNSVTSIGNYAFTVCTGLTDVTIGSGVTSIGFNAFSYCTGLTSVTIPSSVTTIGSWAFFNCDNLTGVNIPDSVTSIGYAAFGLCNKLPFSIYDGVKYLGNDDNPYFALIEKASNSITTVTVHEETIIIAESAFLEYTNLTSVTIGNSVINIGRGAFHNCTNLTSVSLSNSVTSIDAGAFHNCTSLTKVIYCGTQEQWDAISIGSKNSYLTNATLQFHNYVNGLCTICQYKDLVKISGASLVLQSNLAINYKVNKVLFEEYGFTNPYLVVEMNGVKTTITDYYVDGDKYVFSFRNIAPNQMNDTAVATLYATYDGTEYASAARDYSVATYAYNTLGKNIAAELKTLLVDLLHYGAASQTYTDYRTDALVNAELTSEQLTWGTSQDPVLENVLNTKYETVENPTAKWKGAGLYLQDAVAIRLTLEAADITGLSVKIESGDQTWTIPAAQFQAIGDNKYYVYFTGLDAGQMRQSVYLTICNGDTPVSNTARYSICSYAESKQDATDTNLVALLKAMMKYGDSAYAYAN